MVMKEEIIRKYVRDLDGLLKEIKLWEKEGTVLHQTCMHAALIGTN